MITTVTPNAALDKYYLIPGFALQGVHRVQEAVMLPSGKGLNVARVLSRYGIHAVSTGVVAGFTGCLICHLLDEAKQEHDFVWADGESRLCLTVTDPTNDIHTEILEQGPAYTSEVLTELEAKVSRLARNSEFVALSGSPPAGTGADVLCRLTHAARAADARVLLDARGEWLREGIQAKPNIIKPNWQEFQDLTGPCADEQTAVARARRLVDTGIELVLISMGSAGAIAVTTTGAWRVCPPVVKAVSAVGCGDAMVGGLLTALTQNQGLTDALCFATAVAAANACKYGAGVFDLQQVEEMRKQVVLERLV